MTVTDDRPDPPRLDDLPDLIRPPELAKLFRTTENSLSQSRIMGRGVPYVREGRRILYRRQDIEAYLQRNTVQHDDVVNA